MKARFLDMARFSVFLPRIGTSHGRLPFPALRKPPVRSMLHSRGKRRLMSLRTTKPLTMKTTKAKTAFVR
jgi:hypothetical protein